MTKQELTTFIQQLEEDENGRVSFTTKEILSDGRNNARTIYAPKQNIITLISNYFDDNLNGHFKDNIMTTILSYENIPE
jgi:hypothetical protein